MYRSSLCLVFLLFGFTAAAAADKADQEFIQYDRTGDIISLNVVEGSLREQLSRISIMTGIEIKMDDSLEQTITTTLEKQSPLSALKNIAKQYQLNYVMAMREKDGKTYATGFYLLKEGEGSTAGLPPLVDFEQEATARLKRQQRNSGESAASAAAERWQLRMQGASPQKQKAIEEIRDRLAKHAEKQSEREGVRQKIKAEKQKRRAEKKAEREAHMAELKEVDPELHQLRLQQQEKAKQDAMDARENEPNQVDLQPTLEEMGINLDDH